MDLNKLLPFEAFLVAGTDVEQATYEEVDASVAERAEAFEVENTTDSAIVFATGAAASEVDMPVYIAPGVAKVVHRALPAGTRLSVRAVNADATLGFVIINYLK